MPKPETDPPPSDRTHPRGGDVVMDPDTREAAIMTITSYAKLGHDANLLEIIGFCAARSDNTDEMEAALIAAVLPLLSDERIDALIHHIAEVLVGEKAEAKS